MVVVDEKLAFAPAYEVAELVANKQVSPVEMTELFFSRIDKLDSQLHSYLLLTHDEAMASAKAAEEAVVRGDKLGPLHGVPISIKDLQMTKGVRTTGGSLAYKDRVPYALDWERKASPAVTDSSSRRLEDPSSASSSTRAPIASRLHEVPISRNDTNCWSRLRSRLRLRINLSRGAVRLRNQMS